MARRCLEKFAQLAVCNKSRDHCAIIGFDSYGRRGSEYFQNVAGLSMQGRLVFVSQCKPFQRPDQRVNGDRVVGCHFDKGCRLKYRYNLVGCLRA